MVKTVTTAIRVRKRGTSSANFAGRPPKIYLMHIPMNSF